MLCELNNICAIIKEDFQIMENFVGQKLVPPEFVDNWESLKLSSDFDNLYYELAAFSDVYKFPLSTNIFVQVLGSFSAIAFWILKVFL